MTEVKIEVRKNETLLQAMSRMIGETDDQGIATMLFYTVRDMNHYKQENKQGIPGASLLEGLQKTNYLYTVV